MKADPLLRLVLRLATLTVTLAAPLRAWNYPGHRMVNQLALAALPADFPAFVRDPAAAERIAFLAGEPDRWRNVEPALRQSGGSWADHYFDLEQVPDAGLDLAALPSFRYDFIVAFAAGRAAHLDRFPAIDPAKNQDHTREWPGFAPWEIFECYNRLRSAFSCLKVFQELGTKEEVANAEADVIYCMGVLGHFVGDCAQPLHTTVHHNGWAGDNPNGYTAWKGVHSWIDSGFIRKGDITLAELLPGVVAVRPASLAARPDGRDPMFVAVVEYILAQNKLVEPLYRLEKEGKLSDDLEKTGKFGQDKSPVSADGRAFVKGQLLKGGEMLATIWVTAWRGAPPSTYLRSELVRRQGGEAASAPAAAEGN
ncbi:MAG: hypothetical protein EXS39_03930 [Opitutaceae bacterium]|nr:hypothetical protein [Opitutaceae bacterium]